MKNMVKIFLNGAPWLMRTGQTDRSWWFGRTGRAWQAGLEPRYARPYRVGVLVPVLLAVMVFAGVPAVAETVGEETKGSGLIKTSALSVGFAIHEWEDDFGFGGTLTSPWFLWDHGALRLCGAVLFKENFDWQPYYSLRAGLVGGSFMKTAAIRLYGEGGFLFVFPQAYFDAEPFRLGGYGHFGFEFFLDTVSWPTSYYIELGSNGVFAKDIHGSPYLNGFAISCGMRLY